MNSTHKNIWLFLLAGILLFPAEKINAQCVEDGNLWIESWVSCQTQTNPNPIHPNSHWILYEFHQAESIAESTLWNANRTGESFRGVNQIIVDYSTDGNTWISLGTFNMAKAPESSTYQGLVGPDFGGAFIKKILITVVTNHGDPDCSSISEMRFSIDPDACYGTMDACGICNGSGPATWYMDDDNDGLGDPDNFMESCIAPIGYVSNNLDSCDDGQLGWNEVGTLFSENGCLGCHGTGGSGGLNLTTYAGIAQGGNICGPSILTGTTLVSIINVTNYNGCGPNIPSPNMNDRVGGNLDASEIATLQAWIDGGALEHCQCPPGSSDIDGDGLCDNLDDCTGFDNNLIGTSCDDANPCTINDIFQSNCNCAGTPDVDTDQDGVCDAQDMAPDNPCTADGVIDGNEPFNWIGNGSNDCDNDGIVLAQGDLDDFVACISDKGFLTSAECICSTNALIAGGQFVSSEGVGGSPSNGGGIPDNYFSGQINGVDKFTLKFPYLNKGETICITLGFNNIDGVAVFAMNDLGTYRFHNEADLIDYMPQEFCFVTINDGPQEILITEDGSGAITIDGSTYSYCPCSDADIKSQGPACQCPGNTEDSTSNYVSSVGVSSNPDFAAGFPDNQFTGSIGYLDTLILDIPSLVPHAEICVTMGFGDAIGLGKCNIDDTSYNLNNQTGDATYAGQVICFTAPPTLLSTQLIFTDIGASSTRIDGLTMTTCVSCQPGDPDADNDGICDANDPCPLSQFGDSDGDGVCDNLDVCIGFDDGNDTDNDGIPNGCDLCEGADDAIDSDGDGVPDGCDQCPNYNDAFDHDGDGIPDGCDVFNCSNFLTLTGAQSVDGDYETDSYIVSDQVLSANNNPSVQYDAGTYIELLGNFEVKAGASFHAFIDGCGNLILGEDEIDER